MLFDLYIINDLYKKLENNFIRFNLNESEIAKFKIESIPENGMIFLDYKMSNYFLPENLNAGLYSFSIELVCQNSGEKISENKFELIEENFTYYFFIYCVLRLN